ncbi:hypothetical protein MMC14_010613 [Varicellaria rhodocarpa]|nr:hypothetical protein [Varicellaria rhodocarpa]
MDTSLARLRLQSLPERLTICMTPQAELYSELLSTNASGSGRQLKCRLAGILQALRRCATVQAGSGDAATASSASYEMVEPTLVLPARAETAGIVNSSCNAVNSPFAAAEAVQQTGGQQELFQAQSGVRAGGLPASSLRVSAGTSTPGQACMTVPSAVVSAKPSVYLSTWEKPRSSEQHETEGDTHLDAAQARLQSLATALQASPEVLPPTAEPSQQDPETAVLPQMDNSDHKADTPGLQSLSGQGDAFPERQGGPARGQAAARGAIPDPSNQQQGSVISAFANKQCTQLVMDASSAEDVLAAGEQHLSCDRQTAATADQCEVPDDTISEACCVCHSAEDGEVMLLCDRCDQPAHLACVGVAAVPEGDWFCSSCTSAMVRFLLPCKVC